MKLTLVNKNKKYTEIRMNRPFSVIPELAVFHMTVQVGT